MTNYACPLCAKTFSQKIDFTRHTKKKTPCISVAEIQQRMQADVQANAIARDTKSTLIQVLRNCLDIMRDGSGLTGEKALRNLAYLMVLKLLEPRMNQIGIDDYEYEWQVEDHLVETHKQKLLSIARFSNLANEPEDNMQSNLKFLWEDVLSQHPATAKIFLKGKGFDIRNKSTYKRLIGKLAGVDLSHCDALGDAYEDVIKDIMTGKVLGQFFTNPLIRTKMVKIVNPQIRPDGTIETCCDPTMGTGGFLTSYLSDVIDKSKTQNVALDWDFIRNEGIYGKELEPDTYQLAMSNMLIYSGNVFEKLDCGDSIRDPITRKFDIVLANPPFGIKGLKYNEFASSMKSQYLPIKTDNAVSLFIQAIICMLKIGGRCAVVLPDGQDLFSKTGSYVHIREYLMKTCDLKEVYYLPSGVFSNTSIKTCIFHFVKKREGTDVLEIKIKTNATQKETGREYKFSKTHQTTTVKFYDCNPYEEVDNLMAEVSIDDIAANAYSMNYAEYIKGDEVDEEYEDGVVVKTLGEVFKLNGNGKTNSKDITNTGEYPFYKASCNNPSGTHKTYDFDGNDYLLIVKSGGSSSKPISDNYGIGKVFTVNGKCAANIAVFQLQPTTNNNFKYLAYFLKSIQNKIQGLAKYCTNNGNIDMKELMEVKIPIPSLERQQEIVEYLDFIYEKANKTSKDKISELTQLNAYCLKHQRIFGENVVKTLGEISIINPENMKSGQYTEINYIDIASVKGGQILELQKLTYDFPSRAKRIVKKGDILYSSVRPNLKGYVYISDDIQNGVASTGFANIRVKEPNTILSKYLYYIMTSDYISDDLISKAKGAQYPAVSFDDFETIKIPIPSLERQKEIVEYCEYNDTLIKQLEKEIENNKKQAQEFITGIVKAQVQTEEPDDTSSVNTEPIDEVQNEIVSVEEEVIIEPKPKTKIIIKKKVKKPLVIVEEDNEV